MTRLLTSLILLLAPVSFIQAGSHRESVREHISSSSHSSEFDPILAAFYQKFEGQKRRGLERLLSLKTACDLSEEEVATLFPEFDANLAIRTNIDQSCRSSEGQVLSQEDSSFSCDLGGLEAGLKSIGQAPKDNAVKDSLTGVTHAKRSLTPEAAKAFHSWKKQNSCFSSAQLVKEVIRREQILAEEVCQQKKTRAIPPYLILKKMKDQSLFGAGTAAPSSRDSAVIEIYSPEYKEYIVKRFASEEVLRASAEMREIKGTVSQSNTVTGGVNGAADLSLKPLGVGGSIGGGLNAEVSRTETTTKPVNIDFNRIYTEAKAIAEKRPRMTGLPPDYECTASQCRNTSDNVWFPRSEAPQKIGCTPGTNCKLNPYRDEEAEWNQCVEEEVYEYYVNVGKQTRDRDWRFMDEFAKENAEEDLKNGFCDKQFFGAEFCQEWVRENFHSHGAPYIQQQIEERRKFAEDSLRFGSCDPSVFGSKYCLDLRNGFKTHKADKAEEEFDNDTFRPRYLLGDDYFKGNIEAFNVREKGKLSLCRQELDRNANSLSPLPLDQLFSGSLLGDCGKYNLEANSILSLGKCLKGGSCRNPKKVEGELGPIRPSKIEVDIPQFRPGLRNGVVPQK